MVTATSKYLLNAEVEIVWDTFVLLSTRSLTSYRDHGRSMAVRRGLVRQGFSRTSRRTRFIRALFRTIITRRICAITLIRLLESA